MGGACEIVDPECPTLYPVVGIDSHQRLRLNFGREEPFAFNPEHHAFRDETERGLGVARRRYVNFILGERGQERPARGPFAGRPHSLAHLFPLGLPDPASGEDDDDEDDDEEIEVDVFDEDEEYEDLDEEEINEDEDEADDEEAPS